MFATAESGAERKEGKERKNIKSPEEKKRQISWETEEVISHMPCQDKTDLTATNVPRCCWQDHISC